MVEHQDWESRGCAVSMNGCPIRILVVGETKDACRIRGLLDTQGCGSFQISHVTDINLAAERISMDSTDVLLLDLGSKDQQCRTCVQAARCAAPDIPMVVLADYDDEFLALEALRQGVQDFLSKEQLDRSNLVRALKYSIERHRLQKNLHDLSLRDDLTGLYNRRGFMALAEQHLRMLQRRGLALLIYIDLDDLKLINDTHGHLEGNRALIVTANVLRNCFRQSDILARLGGDEFCVLMTDAGQDSAEQVRKRLNSRIDFINGLTSWNFRISLSVGIADVPAMHQPPLEQLLRIADTQMYEDKRKKQSRDSESQSAKQSTVA
jgi:two-component system, cell cycle response regulator